MASVKASTDPDLSEFFAAQAKKGPACAVTAIRERLTPDQLSRYEAALLNPDINAITVVRVLKGWGVPISDGAVRRHRRGVCACQNQ